MNRAAVSVLAAFIVGLGLAAPALADDVFIGGFAHDSSLGVSGTPHEGGTYDVELGYRTAPFHVWWLLNPMAYAKGEINTDRKTSFFTVGAEWRKHLFHTKFYGGFGVGAAWVDGYNTYPNDFNASSTPVPPPTTPPAVQQLYLTDLAIFRSRKAMGSDFLFNPNFTFGYDITPRFGVEGAWEHYSNAGLGKRNPGMDNWGARLVYHFGRQN
jgi:hypothetical protein